MSAQDELVTVGEVNHRVMSLAEPRRALCDRVEDRPDVSRRRGDGAQDRAGRRLLFECLGEIAVARLELFEQPGVLDGNRGLIGKKNEKVDLLLVERPHFSTTHHDHANRLALAQ